MNKWIAAFLLFFVMTSCSSADYNKAGVEKFLNSPKATYWVQNFVNRSNLNMDSTRTGIVVSQEKLSNREIKAIEKYMKDQYNIREFQFLYKPEYQ